MEFICFLVDHDVPFGLVTCCHLSEDRFGSFLLVVRALEGVVLSN
jgi:hypothetical protein